MKIVKIISLALSVMMLIACGTNNLNKNDNNVFKDNLMWEDEAIKGINEIYITIFPTIDKDNNKKYIFSDLINDTDWKDEEEIELDILFQEGKNKVISPGNYGYGLTGPNGNIELRGHSARGPEQKSFKIDINKKAGLWNGFSTINLNKNYFDLSRLRSKLSFDYLKEIDNIVSSKTSFVHLYIKDLSSGEYNNEFTDYGLYTQIENVDKDFLKNRGLDEDGHLYKAEYFEFFRYDDIIMTKDNKDYSKENFERILEIKGSDDHKKLINMLDDVNNKFMNIDEVIDKHFDRENYLTWLAINILLGNIDTMSQNYYLYSPSNTNKWFFIPWDYDFSWSFYNKSNKYKEYKGIWNEGISNYWGAVLHRRFLKNRDNLNQLTEKIEKLYKVFDKDKTKDMISGYEKVVRKYITREPDKGHYHWTMDEFNDELSFLPHAIEENREKYYQNLQKPMPVFMGSPIYFGNYYTLKWDDSYDLQDDYIEYRVEISTTPKFEDIIFYKDGIRDSELVISGIKPGRYFWRLIIKDEDGNTQIPFNIYIDRDGYRYYGVEEFYIH